MPAGLESVYSHHSINGRVNILGVFLKSILKVSDDCLLRLLKKDIEGFARGFL